MEEIGEVEKMHTWLRAFDAVKEARERLPDPKKTPSNEVEIPVKVPVNTEEGFVVFVIHFRRQGYGWKKTGSHILNLSEHKI